MRACGRRGPGSAARGAWRTVRCHSLPDLSLLPKPAIAAAGGSHMPRTARSPSEEAGQCCYNSASPATLARDCDHADEQKCYSCGGIRYIRRTAQGQVPTGELPGLRAPGLPPVGGLWALRPDLAPTTGVCVRERVRSDGLAPSETS